MYRRTLKRMTVVLTPLVLLMSIAVATATAQVPGEQLFAWEDGFQGCTSIMVWASNILGVIRA